MGPLGLLFLITWVLAVAVLFHARWKILASLRRNLDLESRRNLFLFLTRQASHASRVGAQTFKENSETIHSIHDIMSNVIIIKGEKNQVNHLMG